jgi:serine/threonine-protein kinase PRP4
VESALSGTRREQSGTETVHLEVGTMASPALSSDEGEIVEATPLPRSEQNGDVDRTARHRARLPSRTPDDDLPSRGPADGPRRRSRSPRGWKRPRDDHRDRRDTRQFRVHYEGGGAREDRRQYRDLDRPVSRGSDRYDDRPNPHNASHDQPPRAGGHRGDARNGIGYDRSFDRERGQDGYPDKRARTRSRSPRGRFDKGRRDRGRNGAGLVPNEDKYSAQAERRSQDGSFSRRATPVGAPDSFRRDAKTDKGATVERGINDLAISRTR